MGSEHDLMSNKRQARPGPYGFSGILLVNKPRGVTSRAVVNRVAFLVPHVKVGHAGTLDPLAEGVLILCIGSATRLVETIQRFTKTYRAVIRLGARSDTLDADGRIEFQADPIVPSKTDLERVLASLCGDVEQRPPAYSALKIGGRRAYDLARAGRAIEPKARVVRINRIELLRYEWPRLFLEIDCGAGTYIRSIARDVGELVGCGGMVETLIRTCTGPFSIDQAVAPGELSAESLVGHLRPSLEAVAQLPRLVLDQNQMRSIRLGQRLEIAEMGSVASDFPAGQVALIGPDRQLVAIADHRLSEGFLQPRKVLWQ
jgi:tRNA pseudouridine55 synthase